ncbi:Mov34/MPN/PAD-1 family protein [Xylanibacter ruminicola]|uniref:Mov34/MPN/PAD-1 family protein n=1 Tax=Xylanibacter ruminicola TaxID=839 RepID=UPI0009351719|nr:Mov34/MPN/PAD-1 family protein [Xylanibacter ruminicola]
MIVGECSFEIKQNALNALKEYAQHDGNELCGVATGSQIGNNVLRISKISPPCIVKNGRYGCELDSVRGNEFIKQDYEVSGQTRFYIGEWHTHPEQNPHPSQTDYASIIKSYASAQLSVPLLVMIIVGTEHIYFNVYDGSHFKEIEPIIVE